MNEKPILFSGKMVEAIFAGRKTQTRRVIKQRGIANDMAQFLNSMAVKVDMRCPYGQPGDRLWVRETWQGMNRYGHWWHETKRVERPLHNWAWTNPVMPAYDDKPPRWLPGIHMPRMACRLVLEVVNVRVERLQEISEKDALAKGMVSADAPFYDARHEFQVLWDSINLKRGWGWNLNPWVWVIEFKPVPMGA